jgi:hypothetical protein
MRILLLVGWGALGGEKVGPVKAVQDSGAVKGRADQVVGRAVVGKWLCV